MNLENHSKVMDELGEEHIGTSSDTPLRKDAFKINDGDKIEAIEKDVKKILLTLGMDLTDDSLKGTPKRVAKMFVSEIFGGLNPKTNQLLPLLKININTVKCWLKKTLHFILLVSIIYFLLLEKHILLISLTVL